MRRQVLTEFIPTEYESSGMESIENRSLMAEGSRNVLLTGVGKPTAFKGVELQAAKLGTRYAVNAGDSYAGLGDFANSSGKGSVVRVMAGLFFCGTGELHYDGVSLGHSASSVLQIVLLASNVWTPVFPTAAYQAGLSQPSAPTIATRTTLGTGMTGKLKSGTYSVKIYKIRSATGARSNASEASNFAIAVESNNIGQSLRVSFPAADTNGGDRWGICVTPRNFGTTGPYFLLKEIADADLSTIDSVTRSYEIEWTDGDLVGKPLAPVESSPPPACIFAGALGNSVFVDGAYGDTVTGASAASPGTVIACSLPLRPEEFPLDWLAFPPDAPTALLRGGDGFYYRFGKNSLGVISYIGGEPPIAYQLLWGSTGVSYQHNAVVAEGGRLYAKTGSKGLVRVGMQGEPETAWAAPILDDIEGWNDADTVLGWDENNTTVCVMNDRTILPFNSSIGKWGAPLDLTTLVPGKILSAVSHLGAMYISCLDTPNTTIRLYKFNTGTGTVMEIHTDWHFADAETDYIKSIKVKGRFDTTNNVTLKVFKNLSKVSPVLNITLTPTVGAPIELPDFRGLIPDLKSFCISLAQTNGGGDMGFERITVEGYQKGVSQ